MSADTSFTFSKTRQIKHFLTFLMNVHSNVVRFAGFAHLWDFFCDFQTPCNILNSFQCYCRNHFLGDFRLCNSYRWKSLSSVTYCNLRYHHLHQDEGLKISMISFLEHLFHFFTENRQETKHVPQNETTILYHITTNNNWCCYWRRNWIK